MMSIYRIIKIFALIVLIFSGASGQRLLMLSVSVDGETKHVSYIVRNETVFASARELAKVTAGNYYYSPESAKLELKFANYILKFTARNQFLILTSRKENIKHTYQLPISTRLVKDDVFIPLKYALFYINLAAEREIVFNDDKKHLTVTETAVNTLALLKEPVSTPVSPVKPEVKSPSSSKFDVYGIEISEKSNGTLIRIKSKKKIRQFSSNINDNKLYLFLSGMTIEPSIDKSCTPAGLVKSIGKRQVSGNYQLEFGLKEGFAAQETFQDAGSNDILITIHNDKLKTQETDVAAVKEKWQFDTVVIDAGHGGKDPGAIGVTGVKEKDVNLGIALKLGNLIKRNMPDVKVIYTRDDDRFVELYKRGKIANEADGKLFISIHCNSVAKKPSDTNGFEVYLLRPGRTKEAIAIAEFENSVIQYEDSPERYQKLTDENFILVSMAHSSYMRYSERFSDILNNTWSQKVKIISRGIKQAGFYVLVGASMPSVLIEAGFLSSKSDEAYLKGSTGQNDIANTIFHSVQEYRKYYNDTIEKEE